jgi:hypothetical protein
MACTRKITSNGIEQLRTQIRLRIVLIIAGLVFSGVTAFPIEWELQTANQWISEWQWDNLLSHWIEHTYQGVQKTNLEYPFIAYGSDWLGFAHLVIAIVFIGPLKDPIRNRWVVEFGIIACVLIFPFAFVAGHLREIPIFWRVIDCTFGIAGGVILLDCNHKIKIWERQFNALLTSLYK